LSITGCGSTSSSSCPNAPIHCAAACDGPAPEPACQNGQWVCPAVPAILCADAAPLDAGDAAPHDASPTDAARGDGGGIDCGPLTCDYTTQYCDIANGHFVDGATTQYSCEPIPVCEAGSGCVCLTQGCACDDEGGAITVTCDFP
jgi:hypothetical protein